MAGSAAGLVLLMHHAYPRRGLRKIRYNTPPSSLQILASSPPGRSLLLARPRDAPPEPRLGRALHDHPPAEPAHVHVHKHDVACRARGQRRVLPRRRPVLVRDGRGDGRAARLDEPHRIGGERGKDERRGEGEARAERRRCRRRGGILYRCWGLDARAGGRGCGCGSAVAGREWSFVVGRCGRRTAAAWWERWRRGFDCV